MTGGLVCELGLWSSSLILLFLHPHLTARMITAPSNGHTWSSCLLFTHSHFLSLFFVFGYLSPAPPAHVWGDRQGRRLQHRIISQLCGGQPRIRPNPPALFSAFWRLSAQTLFHLFVCFLFARAFFSPTPPPYYLHTPHSPNIRHTPKGIKGKKRNNKPVRGRELCTFAAALAIWFTTSTNSLCYTVFAGVCQALDRDWGLACFPPTSSTWTAAYILTTK